MEDLEAVHGLVKVKSLIGQGLAYHVVHHIGRMGVLLGHPAIRHLAIAVPHLDHLRLLIPFFGEI